MRWRIFALAAFLFLAACGDDDSVSAVPSDDSSSSVEEESSSSSVILSSSEGSSSSFSSGTDKKSSSSLVEQSSFSSTDLQSSSSARSSSSVSSPSAESSSSREIPPRISCNVETDVNCFLDERDGQTYKSVSIGGRVWMAENLNYNEPNSFCYEDDAYYCVKYGRLYSWPAAMSACPEGWYLPSDADWETLFTAVGGVEVAAKNLKSTEGWADSGNGLDGYGFSALSSGIKTRWEYEREGDYTYYWTSSEDDHGNAAFFGLFKGGDDAFHFYGEVEWYSVRCIKDTAATVPAPPVVINPDAGSEYDSLTNMLRDLRDERVYRTVKIDSQVWMAENLNYELKKSYCYDKNSYNCVRYGRLYYEPESKVVCPQGWHLPSYAEWDTLFAAVGGRSIAGKVLKSDYGWINREGTDEYGFTVTPGGYGNSLRSSDFAYEGSHTFFWTSTDHEKGTYIVGFRNIEDKIEYSTLVSHQGTYVRCLKD